MRLFSLVLVLSTCCHSGALFAQEVHCESDAALTQVAARWLAGDLSSGAEVVTPGTLTAAVREAGSDRVHVRGGLANTDAQRRALFVGLGDAAPLVCGEAATAEGTVLVVAERAGTLSVNGRAARYSLAPGYAEPHLVVRSATTRVRLAPLAGQQFDLSDVSPPALLQLMAEGPDGVTPVAQRRLAAPREAGDQHAGNTLRSPTRGRDVYALIDSGRSRDGGRPLRSNALLAEVAEEQAARVCRAARVFHGHAGDDPEARVQRAGLSARVVGEVSSRASSVGAALDALWASPSHELTLLDARFTDAGYGVAEDDSGRTCLVVLLAAWPRRVAVRHP